MVAAAIIGGGAAIAGGAMASSASKKAAKTQAASADQASAIQQANFEQTREDLMPYNQAGVNAIGKLAGFDPSAYQGSGFNYNGSSSPYTSRLPNANVHSNYDGPEYNVGQFNFEESPGYQYRKQQGMDGIQSSAAAQGGLLSGATLKALNNHNSNLASQEYATAHNQYLQNEGLNQNQAQLGFNQYLGQAGLQQNNFNNALQNEQMRSNQHQQAFNNWQSQDNNAYSRYMTDQNNQYNRLNNLVSIGQNAAAGVGNAGMQTAQAVANNTMAGANSIAAGQVGSANAWSNTANDLGSMAAAYGIMNKKGVL
ncbi:hypothetical protein [Acinetobacter sp. YH01008]|uniref:hypothetical protein n=1 Tax=Acinetobacter sp. YH01008 TaxID=2601024 RepID=UPI0015D320AA|nr:hypothetical protein [Acinetobacter sp. YH01008]